jgi:ATP-binding cassette subfamily B protein
MTAPSDSQAPARGAGLRLLFSLAFRADPVRASMVVFPVMPIAFGAMPALMRVLIDAIPDGNRGRVVASAVAIGVMLVVAIVVGFSQFKVSVRLSESIGYEIDRRLIAMTAALPGIEHFERPEHLDRMEMLRTERFALREAMTSIGWSIEAFTTVAVSVLLLATVQPWLALLPLAAVPNLVLGGPAQRLLDDATQRTADRSRLALHLFDVATTPGPAKEIRVFGLRDELAARYEGERKAADRELTSAELRATVLRTVGTLVATGGYVVALVFLVRWIRDGSLSGGDLFLALSISTRLTDQMGRSANMLGSLRHARNVADRFVWLIDRAAGEATADHAAADVPARLTHGIELDGVSFAYDGSEIDALRDVSLHIPAGTVVAIVGENGAGKSSLVKLLFGIYRPTAGDVRVDGVSLSRFTQESWRGRTSACFQDHARFDLRAREVVGIGDLPSIDDHQAVRAATVRAAADEMVERLPGGLNTMLGPTFDGLDLSGGQWQKLAISRAMMRRAPLLLALDEPTSALDPLAEHDLFERYRDAARSLAAAHGTVTVLVAHRFSTVRVADLIVVLADGAVVEVGSHEELMADAGMYAELYSLQARQYL